MSRRAARSKALQVLFAIDIGDMEPEMAIEQFLNKSKLSPQTKEFAKQLVLGTVAARQKLDELISKYSTGWRLERMASVDRNILRMALYEISSIDDIPINVTINEAIELAKEFNDEEAGKFINGILDSAVKDMEIKKQE
ncbi:MAG: transcription antitermination protein NusB [Clostridia bacterium]|nr:transcription antitermination protein NusB [Clostridia bacterium]